MAEHKTLYEALLAFQGEAPTLPKDKTNPHYKSRYTPLDTIVETIGPLLTKHGLVWSALPNSDEHGNPTLRYQLTHVGGETLTGEMPLLLTKQDAQGFGSALTYARRYALSTVLNLVADEDDDGNAARKQPQQPPFGQPFNKARSKDIGTACKALCDGNADQAKLLLDVIKEDCGGYLPEAAAIALIRAANAGLLFPDVKAPEL